MFLGYTGDMNSPAKLPGVFDLINHSIVLYRERLQVVLQVTGVKVLIMLGFVGVFLGSAFLIGFDTLNTLVSSPSLPGHLGAIIGIGLGFFAVLAVEGVLLSWCIMALMQVYVGDEPLLWREAFARARSKVWGFLWIGFLTFLLQIALGAGFLALALLVLFLKLSPWLVALVVVSAVVVLVGVGLRLTFAAWGLAMGTSRGVSALKESWRLSRGYGWPLFFRFFGLGFCAMGIQFGVGMLLGVVALALPERAGSILVQTVGPLFSTMVVAPVATAAWFILYRALCARPVPERVGEGVY